MKRLFLFPLLLLSLSGCAGNNTTVSNIETKVTAANTKILAVATKINTITGTLMKPVGSLSITAICVAQPAYCTAAKEAYTLALAAQKEYAQLLADATAANAAPDGTKLATLAATFQTNFTAINSLIVSAGGTDNSSVLTEFSTALAELKTVSSAN